MKWEYKVALVELYPGYPGSGALEECISELNEYGSEGWEAIGFVPWRETGCIYCFVLLKRAKLD